MIAVISLKRSKCASRSVRQRMMREVRMDFLTEENIAMHKEQLRLTELRYSIITDSIPILKSVNIKEIRRQKISNRDKLDAERLLGDVLAHRRFFSSFSPQGGKDHPYIRRFFGSLSSLQNRMYELAMSQDIGFMALSVYHDQLWVDYARDGAELFIRAEPILVIDLWEHAYFYDYGFDRERYLLRAITHLDFDKLNEIENIG